METSAMETNSTMVTGVLEDPQHNKDLSDFLHESYKSNSLCDVAVTTSDSRTYHAHRVVLAAFSIFFRKKIQESVKDLYITIHIEINSLVFQVLLEFMYTGKLSLPSCDYATLGNASHSLGIVAVKRVLENSNISLSETISQSINKIKGASLSNSKSSVPVTKEDGGFAPRLCSKLAHGNTSMNLLPGNKQVIDHEMVNSLSSEHNSDRNNENFDSVEDNDDYGYGDDDDDSNVYEKSLHGSSMEGNSEEMKQTNMKEARICLVKVEIDDEVGNLLNKIDAENSGKKARKSTKAQRTKLSGNNKQNPEAAKSRKQGNEKLSRTQTNSEHKLAEIKEEINEPSTSSQRRRSSRGGRQSVSYLEDHGDILDDSDDEKIDDVEFDDDRDDDFVADNADDISDEEDDPDFMAESKVKVRKKAHGKAKSSSRKCTKSKKVHGAKSTGKVQKAKKEKKSEKLTKVKSGVKGNKRKKSVMIREPAEKRIKAEDGAVVKKKRKSPILVPIPTKMTKIKRFQESKGKAGYVRIGKERKTIVKVLVPKGKRKAICHICQKGFMSYALCRIHVSMAHGDSLVGVCMSRSLLRRAIYKSFEKNVNRKSSSSGIDCENSLSGEERHKVGKELNYQCDFCEQSFKLHSALKTHLAKDHRHQKQEKTGKILRNTVERVKRTKMALCNNRYIQNERRVRAMAKYERKNITNCGLCGSSIYKGRNYYNHLVLRHNLSKTNATEMSGYPKQTNKQPLTCTLCEVTLKSLRELVPHFMEKHNLECLKFSCPKCDTEFPTTEKMRAHMIGLHRLSVLEAKMALSHLLPCEIEGCSFTTGLYRDLVHHVKTSHPDVEYNCQICQYTFYNKDQLNRHTIRHYLLQDNASKRCAHCDKMFKTPHHHDIHLYREHGIAVGNIESKVKVCNIDGCSKIFFGSHAMKSHQLSMHCKVKQYQCPHCSAEFTQELNCKRHINAMHLGIKPYLCQICAQQFATKQEVKNHVRITHATDKEFKCTHCKFETSDKSYFMVHMYQVHKVYMEGYTRKVLQCPHCDYSAVMPVKFRRHVKAHGNVYDHTCETCGRAFVTSEALASHRKLVHGNQRYPCTQCSYQAKSSTKLKEHIRVQHLCKDLKPYLCPYCDFRCATSANTRKHVQQRHKGLEVKFGKDEALLKKVKAFELSLQVSEVKIDC